MPISPYDGRVIDMLPAALAPAVSPAQQDGIDAAGRGGQPLRMVESTVAFVAARGDDEILLGGEGWQETLVPLGRGDFDGDSKLDWLAALTSPSSAAPIASPGCSRSRAIRGNG